jgi:hypothetical protein
MNPNPPEMMKKCLFVMMSAGLMASGALAQDAVPEAGAKIGGDSAAVAGIDEAMPKDVAKLLEAQLVVADGDEVKAAKLDKGMEYYLVYHSASW